MKPHNKKYIYLISPNHIYKNFYEDLHKILRTNKVAYFQLRLKNYSTKEILLIGKKIKLICSSNKVKFIVNDTPKIAKILDSDGCHLGQSDTKIRDARKIIKNKIIGVTCHNSILLIKKAIESKANYIALGAFYPSNTKKVKYKANLKTISIAKKLSKIPIVLIGGINYFNFKKLLLHKPNFLAISGYIWNNKNLSPVEAIKKITYEN